MVKRRITVVPGIPGTKGLDKSLMLIQNGIALGQETSTVSNSDAITLKLLVNKRYRSKIAKYPGL